MKSTKELNGAGIKNIYKIFFICFTVIGLYYPSLFSDFNSIDDLRLISHLEDTDPTLLQIFLPGESHYYRPVIWLTFFFDKYVGGLDPGFMHLHNLLIHAFNAVFVFLVLDRLAVADELRMELPLFAALLFAVHPINTEAVCWVAGRTDPLATFFILAAAYFLTFQAVRDNKLWLLVSAGSIFLGCLAKEVAFFFFPLAYLATFRINFSEGYKLPPVRDLIRNLIPFVFFSILYLFLRQTGLPGGDKSVSILLTPKTTLFQMLTTALQTFGFYVKKLFIPLPLNFAIVSYSNWYVWLGLGVLMLLLWALWKRKGYYYILAGAFFLITPAVLVAVKPMAWTPVAERYLYAPCAFFTIAIAGILFFELSRANYQHFIPFFLVSLIIICSVITVKRNLIWQDNYLLYEDTVHKSPGFAVVRNELGVALMGRGQSEEATKQFEIGGKLKKDYYLTTMNLANIKFREGKKAEAIAMLTKTYTHKKNAHIQILSLLARIYEHSFSESKDNSQQKKIALDLIDVYHYIYLGNKDPYIAYRSGQHLLFVGKQKEAGLLFEIAYKGAPDDVFYKEAAKKMAYKFRSQ